MRISLLIFLLLFSVCVSGQDSIICRVTQFMDEDSAGAKEELTIVYNNRGQVITETYGRFEETCLSYRIGYTVKYVYNDTLLTDKYVSEKQEPSVRYMYAYNEQGRVKTESKFVWIADPGAMPERQPGMPPPERVPVAAAGKWNQVSLATISYDSKGRKTVWDATRFHDRNENMEKWEYDDENRVTTHMTYAHGKLIRKTDYTYYAGGYRCWDINYDADGGLNNELEEGQGYQPMLIHTFTFDKSGRVYSEKLSSEKGVEQCTKYFWYDKKGRVVRTTCYETVGTSSTTHVYNYPK